MIEITTFVIFAVGMTVVVILSLIGKIHLSLMFLMPLLPLQNLLERFHKYPMGKDFVDIILLAIIVGWIVRSLTYNQRIIEWTPLNKVLFIMIVFTYVSLWQGSSYLNMPAPVSIRDIRLQNWKNYMVFPLLYFVTVNNVRDVKHIRWLVFAMLLSMFVMDFYTGKQIKWMPSLVSREKIVGTFVWAGVNVVAAFYAQYLFVIMGIFIMYKERFFRLVCAGLIIAGLYITLFLYSRGAYLAVITGLMTLSMMKNKVFMIPLFILLILWQFVLPESVIQRISYTQAQGSFDSSSQQRIELWKAGMKLFEKNPVTGVGFNTIPFVRLPGGFKDTHNIYVKLLAEQGMIGTLIILVFFWLSLKMGVQLYATASDTFLKGLGLGFAACVVATMTTNFFGDRWTYQQLDAYYWVYTGLTMRGLIISERGEEEAA